MDGDTICTYIECRRHDSIKSSEEEGGGDDIVYRVSSSLIHLLLPRTNPTHSPSPDFGQRARSKLNNYHITKFYG